MTQPYYECHITFEGSPGDNSKGRVDGEAACASHRWKFSVIDGGPIMGGGSRMYATRHFNQRVPTKDIWNLMQLVRRDFEKGYGLKVTRCKIELVTHDERYT